MNNLLGITFSFLLIVFLLVISILLRKLNLLSAEGSRKLIHIGAGHWWIIAMLCFDNIRFAILPPFIYIILNYISYRFDLIKPMERNDDALGTIYYPFSLLVLVIFTFGIIKQPYIGLVGSLLMAYGDGLAALVGKNVHSPKIWGNKTLAGSLAMFIASLIITITVVVIFESPNPFLIIMLVPIGATLLELFSLKGRDNLTVPILSTLLFYLLTII